MRRSEFVDLDVSLTAWVALLAVIVVMLAIDLYRHRDAHAPTPTQALSESIVWVLCGLGFAGVVAYAYGSEAFGEYLSGYFIEKSLSVDNVFVWSMLFTTLAIPVKYQHRVLFWGIFGALAMRAAFIVVGSALITRFWWLLLIFGLFLVYTGAKVIRHRSDEGQAEATLASVTSITKSAARRGVAAIVRGARPFRSGAPTPWRAALGLLG